MKKLRGIIITHGHVVQVVLPNGDEAGWAYTVGLHGHGLPELIVIGGMTIPEQHNMLNALAERLRDGDRLAPGQRDDSVLIGFDVIYLEVGDTTTEDFAVANRLQSGFRALQVVWPDLENRMPWEPGYAVPADYQRLLGVPPVGDESGRRAA